MEWLKCHSQSDFCCFFLKELIYLLNYTKIVKIFYKKKLCLILRFTMNYAWLNITDIIIKTTIPVAKPTDMKKSNTPKFVCSSGVIFLPSINPK